MKRPNAILHMMLWCACGGVIAILTLATLVGYWLLDGNLNIVVDGLVRPQSLRFLGITGIVPGAIAGVLGGWYINRRVGNLRVAFTRDVMKFYEKDILTSIFFSVWLCCIILFIVITGRVPIGVMFGCIPGVIAPIIAAYAAHRYLLRFHLWSVWSVDSRKEKSKRKNDAFQSVRLTESHSDNLPDDYQPDHQAQSEINS